MKKQRTWKGYVLATYLTFWMMVLVLCGGASMIFHAPPVVMRLLSNLCAWSPTIVLLLMLPRLRPGQTVCGFLKESFSGAIRPGLLLLSAGLTLGAFGIAVVVTDCWTGMKYTSAWPVLASVLFSLTSGPTGEECGWRGYLRPELEKRYGFLHGAVVVGLVWAFWHAVLWAVDNDFTSGGALAIYIVANVVVLIALNIIMSVVLERENNLLYAMLIHLCFNLPYCFLAPSIEFYIVLTFAFSLAAAVALLVRKRWVPNVYVK